MNLHRWIKGKSDIVRLLFAVGVGAAAWPVPAQFSSRQFTPAEPRLYQTAIDIDASGKKTGCSFSVNGESIQQSPSCSIPDAAVTVAAERWRERIGKGSPFTIFFENRQEYAQMPALRLSTIAEADVVKRLRYTFNVTRDGEAVDCKVEGVADMASALDHSPCTLGLHLTTATGTRLKAPLTATWTYITAMRARP